MSLSIVPVEDRHIIEICQTMRAREASAVRVLGRHPEPLLRHEIATSWMSWAGLIDEEVFAVGGIKCADFLTDEAYAWLFCSEVMARHPIAFARSVLEAFDRAKERFGSIWGWVEADFAQSVRWLEWMGFHIEEPDGGMALFWYGKPPQVRH